MSWLAVSPILARQLTLGGPQICGLQSLEPLPVIQLALKIIVSRPMTHFTGLPSIVTEPILHAISAALG